MATTTDPYVVLTVCDVSLWRIACTHSAPSTRQIWPRGTPHGMLCAGDSALVGFTKGCLIWSGLIMVDGELGLANDLRIC